MDNTKLKVINLFGAPGSGKSKIAQLIAGMSFKYGNNIQYVDEYAKKLCWEKSDKKRFENQVLITAEQYTKQLVLLENNIEYCVTDSPIIFGTLYSPENYFNTYNKLCFELFESFTNYNFLIKRGDFDYESVGRNEDEASSDILHRQQTQLLINNNYDFTLITNLDALDTAMQILQLVFCIDNKPQLY